MLFSKSWLMSGRLNFYAKSLLSSMQCSLSVERESSSSRSCNLPLSITTSSASEVEDRTVSNRKLAFAASWMIEIQRLDMSPYWI